MAPTQPRAASWTCLEDVLVATKPGHTLSVNKLVRLTGLSIETAGMVLSGLTRAELFVRLRDGVFRRQSLFVDRGRVR